MKQLYWSHNIHKPSHTIEKRKPKIYPTHLKMEVSQRGKKAGKTGGQAFLASLNIFLYLISLKTTFLALPCLQPSHYLQQFTWHLF